MGGLPPWAASKLTTVTFDVRDREVPASWCGPDRHDLRRAASPARHFKRRGRASVELDGTRSCSCCEVRPSVLARRRERGCGEATDQRVGGCGAGIRSC